MKNKNLVRALEISFSLVLPAFNASTILHHELPLIAAWMRQHYDSYEIIVIDDGSKDVKKSAELCTRLGCIHIALPINKGKGAALRAGFTKARGKVQIFTDCDIPFDYNSFTEMYALLQSRNYAVVIGDRSLPASAYYMQISTLRKWGSNIIAFVATRLLQEHITDTQCGLKGFTKESAQLLMPLTTTNRFGIDFELLYLCTKLEMPVARIPVTLRTSYPSTVHVISDGLFTIFEICCSILQHANKKPNGR